MVLFIYQLFLGLGFLFYLPKSLLRKKGGPSLSERFGLTTNQLKKTKPLLIWIHAVSLGETKAITPLAKMLQEHYGSETEFVVTSGTATALAEVKKAMPFCSMNFYLPIDFNWVVKPLVKQLKPDLLLISETDL